MAASRRLLTSYAAMVRREEPRIEREGDVDIRGTGAQQFGMEQPEDRP